MNFIYLNKYKEHPEARVNPSLLWEYDLSAFDYHKMRYVVVQRVVERGWPSDWWAILNLYGEDGVEDAIRNLPYLSDDDMAFAARIFHIPMTELKCYERKLSRPQHWNS